MQRDWKSDVGFLLVALGVTGLVHSTTIERARLRDDQASAARWTPDDTAIIIEQQMAEAQREHGGPFPACGCDAPKLMDQPIGDFRAGFGIANQTMTHASLKARGWL